MLELLMWSYDRGRSIAACLMLLVVLTPSIPAAEKSWNKIRYQGGTIEARVNPFDWNTTLKLSSTGIEIVFAGRKKATIDARNVIALTYGEKAYRHITDMLTLRTVSQPVTLFGIVRTSKDHLVGIEFKNVDGTPGAVLLSVHKDSYHELLDSLKALTGKPIDDSP